MVSSCTTPTRTFVASRMSRELLLFEARGDIASTTPSGIMCSSMDLASVHRSSTSCAGSTKCSNGMMVGSSTRRTSTIRTRCSSCSHALSIASSTGSSILSDTRMASTGNLTSL
ncbi:unnamed protein product [Prorocentrum cordatum]|uniref:Uncharacterized protein n=1 Tax=Prorocentrum cordatum TaxID=2364126 RepID=A0ABN9PQU2_9DINO|nr:unnamed protein product [Polarella glacialis]